MKPDFALILSFEGIGLVHRAASGWHLVGHVPLEAPDLAAELAQLRARAQALAPDGVRSKLVLPNDQIRFLNFEADDLKADDLDEAVRQHLTGATPYPLDELAYDWSISAGQVFVAAVARDTLAEAEAFARQHGFEPLCFVATPDARDFVGEPWFGPTEHARSILTEGTLLERDTAAVRVTGRVAAPPPAEAEGISDASDAGNLSGPADPGFRSIRAEGAPNTETDREAAPAEPQGPAPIAETPRSAATEDWAFASRRPQPTPPRRERPRITGDTARGTPSTGQAPAPADRPSPRIGRRLAAGLVLALGATAGLWLLRAGEGEGPQTPIAAEETAGAPSDPEGSAPARTLTAGPPEAPAPGLSPEVTPQVDPEMADDALAALPERDAADAAPDPLDQATAAAKMPRLDMSLPPTAEEAQAHYEATGIWLRAPDALNVPPGQTLADFYQTSIDPRVDKQDAIALPLSTAYSPDPLPTPLPGPVPPGPSFEGDPRGLVRATPDGALTPGGVPVFAGRPALLPPPRPAETRQDAPQTEPGDDGPDQAEAAPARLSAVRPRLRPDDLSEQNERAALGSGGRTQAELAALRPRPRPPSAQELAEQSAAADGDGPEQESGAPFAGATAQAVAASPLPRARPEGFDRVVAQAAQAAQQRAREAEKRKIAQQQPPQPSQDQARPAQTQNQTQTQSASPAQPVLEPEETRRSAAAAVPRNQRLTPSTRTAPSVARAATEKNVLRLRRINLIGVYGGPSDRRALVRLANGRYKKVQVGDRLDGGRVTAISASELRYSKGGKNLALTMPKG